MKTWPHSVHSLRAVSSLLMVDMSRSVSSEAGTHLCVYVSVFVCVCVMCVCVCDVCDVCVCVMCVCVM